MRVPRAGSGLLVTAAVLAVLTFSPPASADSVTDWNKTAMDILITPPPAGDGQGASSIAQMAMVQGAVYDAVNAIDGVRYEPLVAAPPARRWYSKDAAVAAAAYRVLTASDPPVVRPERLPVLATLAPIYQGRLDAIPDGLAKDRGIATGIAAADAMIAARTDDGRFEPPIPFTEGLGAGEWRPPLPPFVNDPFGWLRNVNPFLVRSAAQFGSRGPHPLTSRKYAREFDEVKTLGSAMSTQRTADQTNAAQYWGLANATGTWSAILRAVAQQQGGSVADNARLFAMAYTATADALITVWVDKEKWHFWRPITAIREAANDGNPKTEADPGWLPLIGNPPYPEHPSGLSALGGAMATTLRGFYRTDRVAFTVPNAANPPVSRSFTRFSQAIDDIVDARVWSGIHFRFADEQGARVGERVARWAGDRYFGRRHCRH